MGWGSEETWRSRIRAMTKLTRLMLLSLFVIVDEISFQSWTSRIVQDNLRDYGWECEEYVNECSNCSIHFVIIDSILLICNISALLMHPLSIYFCILFTLVMMPCCRKHFISSCLYWVMARGLVEVRSRESGYDGLLKEFRGIGVY